MGRRVDSRIQLAFRSPTAAKTAIRSPFLLKHMMSRSPFYVVPWKLPGLGI